MVSVAYAMASVAAAQDLEPRAYSPAPVGTNFIVLTYSHSSGDVLLDPIGAVQAHVSYTLRPGMWAAVDGIYYTGGRTTVDGVQGSDLQQHVRVGLTFALPIKQTQSLKFQYTRGAVTRVGGSYTSGSVTYQYRFMTRK